MRVAARMLPSSSLAPTAARRRSFALGRLPLPPSSAAAIFPFLLILRSQHLMIFNASFDQVGQISAATSSFGLCEDVRGKPQQLTPLLCSTRIAIYYYYYYTHTYTHTYIHTYTQLDIHTHIHKYTHTYTHTNIHTYIHTYTYAYIHIYSFIHITHIHTYTCTYTHIYIHT